MKYWDGLCHQLPSVKTNWIQRNASALETPTRCDVPQLAMCPSRNGIVRPGPRSRVLKIVAAALAGITIVHIRKGTMLTTLTEFSLTMPVYMMDLVRIPLKKVFIHWSAPIESDRRNFKGTVLLHSIAIAANSPRQRIWHQE